MPHQPPDPPPDRCGTPASNTPDGRCQWELRRGPCPWHTYPVAELDAVAAGLDPEQEIRARAASLAADIVDLPRIATPEAAVAALTDVAELLVAWIRDGSRPETPDPGDGGGGRR